MNEYIIYTFQPYSLPSIQMTEIEAGDIISAIQGSGIPINEIISIKLKAPIAFDAK